MSTQKKERIFFGIDNKVEKSRATQTRFKSNLHSKIERGLFLL